MLLLTARIVPAMAAPVLLFCIQLRNKFSLFESFATTPHEKK
jgi:hypothetical protein